MAVGDRQKLITEIVSTVLCESAQTDINFPWFINKHLEKDFVHYFPFINTIFDCLNGDILKNQNKRTLYLACDAYFAGKHNFIFEYDEFQHFSSYRLKALECYPQNLELGFDLEQYKLLCRIHKNDADKYRSSKKTVDFNFEGGRTAQRAYLDCFRDLLPNIYGLNPTVRITEFETNGIYANNEESQNQISNLLKSKIRSDLLLSKL